MPKGGYRNWCFTLYNDPDDGLFFDEDKIDYVIYQKEICPKTKRDHWQGYVEFKNQLRQTECQKALGDKKPYSAHVEPRKGNQEQAIVYCKKLESAVENTLYKWGTPKKQGNRSDLDSILDAVKSGNTKREILDEFGGNAMRLLGYIEKAMYVYMDLDVLDRLILNRRADAHEKLLLEQSLDLQSEINASEVEGNTTKGNFEKQLSLPPPTIKMNFNKLTKQTPSRK